jgi:NADPH-dependent 2,4-dienoyl-CoA reductase/sulfur reductase-like enzyme/rhodanese-related sulfurtransferase
MKLLIVGGVAGGASAAARGRRLSEQAEIVLFEKGPYISYANCGLPYYIGHVIEDRNKLLVFTPEQMKKRFNIDVRTSTEVLRIERQEKRVEVKKIDTGELYMESYDKLILSPGAEPIKPLIPGIDGTKVMTLRSVQDMDKIRVAVDAGARKVTVIGGGYIGLEMVDNLSNFGLEIHLVEMLPRIMPLIDPEIAFIVQEHIKSRGVQLHLGKPVQGFKEAEGRLVVRLHRYEEIECNFAVLSVGVKPSTSLAVKAGLDIGPTGGIKVDDYMRTSDPDIYAVGDAVEVKDFITSRPALIPLAGLANRQGRIAADNVFGRASKFRGAQGTVIVKVFDLTVASTGASEIKLKEAGIAYEKIYLHPTNHAQFYPGASDIRFKLLYSPEDGRILGAQIVGVDGVDKRVDVIAMAIQAGMTVFDLEECELAYAPQLGAAKDPVNMAGFVASNILKGDCNTLFASDVPVDEQNPNILVLDVRTSKEYQQGTVPGAVNIPLDELRARIGELPKDKKIYCFCRAGLRSYIANRILKQNGLEVYNISGGYLTFCSSRPEMAYCDEIVPKKVK